MNKHRKGKNFLDDLQLEQAEPAIADTVGRHLDQVLEEGNSPVYRNGDEPVTGPQIFQVAYQA